MLSFNCTCQCVSVSVLILHHSIMYQSLVFICVILATASAQEDPCYREGTNCYKYYFKVKPLFKYFIIGFRQGLGNEIGHTPYFPDIWACELACR